MMPLSDLLGPLVDDGNTGFNSKLIDTTQLASVSAMTTPRHYPTTVSTPASSQPSSPSFVSLGGKSFLDDDWLLNRVEHDSNMAQVAAGLVRPRSAVSRCRTPRQGSGSPAFRSLNESKTGSPNGDRLALPIPPPSHYTCKLCHVAGHWLKDCQLFEPRQPVNGSKSAFGHIRASSSVSSQRGVLPPGNYVCRLCGVAGHWIEQCQMFQPKHASSAASSGRDCGKRLSGHASFRSIPPPPGYVCNLCEMPGHWLQQCSRFEPMTGLGKSRKDRR